MLSYYLSLLSDPDDAPLMCEMYELYQENLYKYAISLLQNQSDAQDAVQATWEGVARQFGTAKKCFLESHATFFAYAITAVKNYSINESKRKSRTTVLSEDWDAPDQEDVEGKSEYDFLVDMIHSMPNSIRAVLEMRLILEISFKEIGKRLRCSEDAARMRCGRAMDELKKRMRENGYVCAGS